MRAYERLIRYSQVDTTSKEDGTEIPSTKTQFQLGELLAAEMKAIGMEDIALDEHAYVYGFIPASKGCENRDTIALIAHLDTAPDFAGDHVRPQIVEHYDGGDLQLGQSGRILSPSVFPDLKNLVGHTLITTDGNTLLGADDKAGIAEVMTVCEEIIQDQPEHGRIAVCFTPDEEIGHGAALLSMERLGADYAYTIDGDDIDTINCETFNAAEATVSIHGVNVHPGTAKNKMRNAAIVAMEFNALLPAEERPEHTDGYAGFYHLVEMEGNVETAYLRYIVRDHSACGFDERKEKMRQVEENLNEHYGEGTVHLSIREQYRNMEEVLTDYPQVAERAVNAIRKAGFVPKRTPVRGGTDGAQLSFRGLPCPNLGTGGAAFHGPYEHISAENMDHMVRILKIMRTDP